MPGNFSTYEMDQFCISRRACADRHSFKLYQEEGGTIKESYYIWTEYRCPNQAGSSKNPDYCSECAVKIPGFKYVANPKCDHGYIGGPYPKESKLYGSPYYLLKSKEGWKIRESDEKRAKECQEKANSMGRKKMTTAVTTSETPVAPVAEKPKIPKVPKVPKVAKKATSKVEPISDVLLPLASGPATYIESTLAPLIITDVIRVKVKKIKISGTEYFLDSKTRKVYGLSKNGVGPYKGRYHSEEGTLDSSYPDSDAE
jgi:hypothetical protein